MAQHCQHRRASFHELSKTRHNRLMLVDSHCHLDHWTEDEIGDVVARAHAAGVTELVTIGVRMAQSEAIRTIAERHQVWCTAGVHPQNAGELPVPTPEAIAALTDHPRCIGIGESGLDYFYETAPRDAQQASFRAHIRAARLAGVPLAIHARAADADILAILQEENRAGGPFAFLLHCFSSGRELAEGAIALGGYVSFSGILTFPKSSELREIAADIPAERLLVETDAPYLAPVPLRGKRCEPALVAHTAARLAEVRGLSVAQLAALTTDNFHRLYPRAC
jgi:TatD DNase family protein